MHPAEGGHAGDQGFDVGQHSAPLLRRMGEELAKVIEERVDLGPDSQQLARVWGHGIVGMMHAAGDWWLANAPAPGRSWYAAWPTCCGAGWRRRATSVGGPGVLSVASGRAAGGGRAPTRGGCAAPRA